MATSISNLNVENWKVWQKPASTQKLVVNLLKDYQLKEKTASEIYIKRVNMLNSHFLATLKSKSLSVTLSYAKENMTVNEYKAFSSVRDAMQKLNDEMRQEFPILVAGE